MDAVIGFAALYQVGGYWHPDILCAPAEASFSYFIDIKNWPYPMV